jgi:hypothetical protein
MAQAQEVPQFVDRLFHGPGFEEAGVPGLAVKFRVEPGQRDDGDAATGIGQAKDKVETGRGEVHPGDPQNYLLPPWAGGGQDREKRVARTLAGPLGAGGRERQVPFYADHRAQFPG